MTCMKGKMLQGCGSLASVSGSVTECSSEVQGQALTDTPGQGVVTHCCCCCCCRLMPGVEKVARAAADPELRDVASAAIATLERVSKEGEEAAAQPEAAKAEAQVRWCVCVFGGGG
jgi:hypothetical protein